MRVIDLPVERLHEAPWNPNQMGPAMLGRLKQCISKFGLLETLVVRPLNHDTYEVLSGNQRVKLLREMGFTEAPCVVVSLDDAQARLLSQALNASRVKMTWGCGRNCFGRCWQQYPRNR